MSGVLKLLSKNLPEELMSQISEHYDLSKIDYVPRSRLNQVIGERDTALADFNAFKNSASNNTDESELAKQLAALQLKYDNDIAAKDAEFNSYKRGNTVDTALNKAGAKNLVAVKALLNEEALGEDLAGLEAEVARLVSEEGWAFDSQQTIPAGTGTEGAGVAGAASGTGKSDPVQTDTSKYMNAIFGG